MPTPGVPVGSTILGAGSNQNGLQVYPDRTLALIGGQINIDGGVITSPSGNIEISSTEQGAIKFDLIGANIAFDYSEVDSWKDIYLDEYALLDASGISDSSGSFIGGGTINLNSKNLQIDNGSLIFYYQFRRSTVQ